MNKAQLMAMGLTAAQADAVLSDKDKPSYYQLTSTVSPNDDCVGKDLVRGGITLVVLALGIALGNKLS